MNAPVRQELLQAAEKSFSQRDEQRVLGCLLINEDAWDQVKNVVKKEDFQSLGHQRIFDAIGKLHEANLATDAASVQQYLDSTHGVDCGGYQYLTTLLESIRDVSTVRGHAQIVANLAAQRRSQAAQIELLHALQNVGNATDLASAIELTELVLNRAKTQLPPSKFKQKYEIPQGMLASDLFTREKVLSDFVLPGFIAGTVGALIAPGSTGKSMLAMELAALVAGANVLGPDFGQLKIGDVLILAVEDPANELYNRWTDLGARLDPQQRKAGDRVRIVPMLGHRFDIMRDECFDALMQACNGKRLLILDTLRRIHCLDENDGGDMAQVIGRLEEIAAATGCAILFLHHTGKSATLNGQGDQQQASRGSTVLVDNIRYQMFMAGLTDDELKACGIDQESKKFFVRMGVSKQNYGAKIGDVYLRRTDGGILVPAEFARSWVTTQKPVQKREKKVWK
jgi:hypothetical protein